MNADAGHRHRAGLRWLRLAACAGIVHAGFSLYWASGGTWLLDALGQWAVRAATNGGLLTSAGLAATGMLKLGAALAPLLVERRKELRPPRWYRILAWTGATGLIFYGGANTMIAALVLNGVIRSDGGYDRVAMVGHATLWDPLFLIWGILLSTGLVLTRPLRRAA